MPRSQDALQSPWHPPHPVPLYSSESGVETMGVKMRGVAAEDPTSVFHGTLLLDQECEGHDDLF